MRRREFITLLGGAAATWPLAARGQQSERVRRIGVLSVFGEDDPEMKAWLAAFRQQLEGLGWSEGRNVRIDARFSAADVKRTQALAQRAGRSENRHDSRTIDGGRRRAPEGDARDPDRVRCRVRPDRFRFRRAASPAPAAISPDWRISRRPSPASGWECSRRSHRAPARARSWPIPRRPPMTIRAGGRGRRPGARDRACRPSGRDRRRHRALNRVIRERAERGACSWCRMPRPSCIAISSSHLRHGTACRRSTRPVISSRPAA